MCVFLSVSLCLLVYVAVSVSVLISSSYCPSLRCRGIGYKLAGQREVWYSKMCLWMLVCLTVCLRGTFQSASFVRVCVGVGVCFACACVGGWVSEWMTNEAEVASIREVTVSWPSPYKRIHQPRLSRSKDSSDQRQPRTVYDFRIMSSPDHESYDHVLLLSRDLRLCDPITMRSWVTGCCHPIFTNPMILWFS